MRQRSSVSNHAEVAAVPHQDTARLKKTASNAMKNRVKPGKPRVSMSIWGFAILLIGVVLLLLHTAMQIGSSIDSERSKEEKATAFMRWFQSEGGNVSSSIAIKTFPGMGKGVVASKPVEENQELLFVPSSIIICRDTIAREWGTHPKLLKKMAKIEADQEELLTAFLLLERAKGGKSRWSPYLDLLPTFSSRNEVASPLLFSHEDIVDALQDERMIREAKRERQRATKAYGRFKRMFSSYLDEEIPLPRYKWARFLVNSRAFSIRGQRVLVPFGDVFNGEPHHKARQFDNGERFLGFHDLQPEGMAIRADRDTSVGEQLFEDYGDNSNYVYFLFHGFLMHDRGFDCAAFHLPSAVDPKGSGDDRKEVLTAKARFLSRIRVDDAPLACIFRDGNVEDAELLRIYTLLLNMNDEQLAICDEARSFSECFAPELMAADDSRSRLQDTELLLRGVSEQMKRYSTTINEDLAMLRQETHSPELKHAITFRSSRKQLLLDVQVVLEQRVKQLESEAKLELQEQLKEFVDDSDSSDKLERFERWLARQNFPINHLELRFIDEAMGFGTFATKPLAVGDVYLSVPVQVVMNVNSAVRSAWVRKTIREVDLEELESSREDVLLLLHVLEETFGPSHRSRWKPYLDMLPQLDEEGVLLGSPLFYEENGMQLHLLEGTDLYTLVLNYRERVRRSYDVLSHQLRDSEAIAWLTERRFRWANAIIDSRSIWWSGQRHLVPLLDMVNCQELDLRHEPHRTTLDSSGRHAVTKASWQFEAGQQVVENYAQPNYIYLLYHGFVLPSNSHDCAHFHLKLSRSSARPQELVELLRKLKVFSWTPDVCVSPHDEEAVTRFAKVALVSLNQDAIEQLKAAEAPQQAFVAGLELVSKRLQQLESLNTDSDNEDFRTKAITKYREQQLQHMRALQDALQALKN